MLTISDMGHMDGHGTEIRTWDIRTDMEIRTDMGHTDGHGTFGRTFTNKISIFWHLLPN